MSPEAAWFQPVALQPDARVTLLCFPHAGGGASTFRDWGPLMPPSVEAFAVQYPGRQNRFAEPCIPDMDTLAGEITRAVHRQLRGPLVFFGHSMGSLVAFEVARRLAAEGGAAVLRLFASAGGAPSERRDGDVHLRDDDGLLDYVRRLGGAGAALLQYAELREVTLPMVRNDLGLVGTYRFRPGAPLACPISALVGADDASFTAVDAGGWAEHTTGGFEVSVLPGGHFYLDDHRPRLVRLVLDRIDAELRPAVPPGAAGRIV